MNLQSTQRQTRRPERAFWIGLSCAMVAHAGLIFEIGRASPRIMGEKDGSPEALSVELVDISELGSKTTVPPQSATAVPAPPSQPAAAPPAPADDAPAAAETAPPAKKSAELTPDTDAFEKAPPPSVPAKPSEAAPKPKDKPHPERKPAISSLQLDLPPDMALPGNSAGATRPPDITRSGENDEFGRRVIRALRQTMPPPRGEAGRVTVRLLISDKGNLAELQLIRGASDPILTQNVVFAVKQSSFPFPPAGATLSDRTFLVTYVYR